MRPSPFGRSDRRRGTRSPISPSGTTACGAAAGARGSTRSTARRRSRPRPTAPSRSGWSRRGAPTPRWSSTETWPSPGVSSESPQELPNIKHRKEYEAELDTQPDYRLTCFFVDKGYRRRGVSALALQGALDLIAAAGGGVVEAYPQDTGGKKISASFLYSVTRSLFEQAGFTYVRPKGKNHTVMRTKVEAAR